MRILFVRHSINSVIKGHFAFYELSTALHHNHCRWIFCGKSLKHMSSRQILPFAIKPERRFIICVFRHIDRISSQSQNFKNAHALMFSFYRNVIKFTNQEFIANQNSRCRCNNHIDAIFFAHSFEAGGEIYRVAQNSIIESFFRTNISHHHFARGNSHTKIDWIEIFFFQMIVKIIERASHMNRSSARIDSVKWIIRWRSKKSHHRIANIFIERSLMLNQNIRHSRQIICHQHKKTFGVHFF